MPFRWRACTSGRLMYSPISCRNNVMKFLSSILGLVFLLVGIARAETPRPKAFTAAAAAARAAVPSAQVAVKGDLQLEARSPGGAKVTLDLGNTYELYLHSPQRLDDLIRHAADALVDT